MMAVPVSSETVLVPGNPIALFNGPYATSDSTAGRQYDVARDGRFLMVRTSPDSTSHSDHIVLVQHWTSELRERVPVD